MNSYLFVPFFSCVISSWIIFFIENSKFIAKPSDGVATSALLNKIVLEAKCRGCSFEVNQSMIDVSANF